MRAALIVGTMGVGLANCQDAQQDSNTPQTAAGIPFCGANPVTNFGRGLCRTQQTLDVNLILEGGIKTYADGGVGFQRQQVERVSGQGRHHVYPDQVESLSLKSRELSYEQRNSFVELLKNKIYDFAVGDTEKTIRGKLKNKAAVIQIQTLYARGEKDSINDDRGHLNLYMLRSLPNGVYALKFDLETLINEPEIRDFAKKYNLRFVIAPPSLKKIGELHKDPQCATGHYEDSPPNGEDNCI